MAQGPVANTQPPKPRWGSIPVEGGGFCWCTSGLHFPSESLWPGVSSYCSCLCLLGASLPRAWPSAGESGCTVGWEFPSVSWPQGTPPGQVVTHWCLSLDSSHMNREHSSGLRHLSSQLFTHRSPEHLLLLRNSFSWFISVNVDPARPCTRHRGKEEEKVEEDTAPNFREPEVHANKSHRVFL